MAAKDRRDQRYSTISTVGADAKKGGAGGSYTWGTALDVPTDYQPVGYSQQQVMVAAAPQIMTATAAATAPVPMMSDASAFPALGAAPAAPVTAVGWGPGSQARMVVQQPVASVAPIRSTVEFGAQHPRNAFARIPRTTTGGSVITPAQPAIDWSAPGTTAIQQAVLTQSGNPAHLGPYQAAAPAVSAMPLQVMKQQQVFQPPPKNVAYSAPVRGYVQPKVTQARGR